MRTSAEDRRLLQKLAQNSLKAGLQPRSALHTTSSLSEVFHENTKLGPLSARAYSAWIVNYARARRDRTPLRGGKVYTLMERRAIPSVEARTDLERTIAARRSIRAYSGAPLGLEDLSRLLFFAYGRTDRDGRSRAVPSGGGLYPLELYVVSLTVDGLDPGVYHYDADGGHLDVVRTGQGMTPLRDLVNGEGLELANASLAIVIAAAFRRNTIKYLDRGYRMILMEAGAVAQNLSLVATTLGLGACLVGGFHDDLLSELLDIDGVEEAPLLTAVVGRLRA